MQQASKAGGARSPRGPRITLAVALACWVIGALVFSRFSSDTGRYIVAIVVYSAAAAFAVISLARATLDARGRKRRVWGLVGAGLLVGLVADLGWSGLLFGSGLQSSPFASQEVSYQHVAYLVSYLLLTSALLCLVGATTRRITLIVFLDSLSIMLSVGMVIWYFFLGRAVAEAGSSGSWSVFLVLSWPLFDAALLFLSLVVYSTAGRPPFALFLISGFLSFAVADGMYLGVRAEGSYGIVGWPDMLWALGLLFLGFAAEYTAPAEMVEARRIGPWRIFAFWLGPLSPPLHFGIMLFWGATHPPLPAYVGLGGAILFLYLAVRVALVSFASRRIAEEQEEEARRLEHDRLLYELHDTVKQSVHGVTLALSAAIEAERRGERETAQQMLDRALQASREAEYRVSKPYDDLRPDEGEDAGRPEDYLRHRLAKFEEYFGIKTHEDFRVPLNLLSPDEIAAAQRVFVEAFWNVAKHSGARNLWLETRRVDSVIIVRTRDDGRGFDLADPPPGLGLRYMRRRAAEAGAELDVISAPTRGTIVQLRFDKV